MTATLADSKVASKADDVYQELKYRQTHEPCWVKQVTRGDPTKPDKCPAKWEIDLGGTTCYKPCIKEYYIGVNTYYCYKDGCPKNYGDLGDTCTKPFMDFSTCPWGMKEYFVGICTKNSYTRVTKPADERCHDGKVLDKSSGLCYKKCPRNTDAVGGLCVGTCPVGMDACGAGLCLPKGFSCSREIMQKVSGAFDIVHHAASIDAKAALKSSLKYAKSFQYPICDTFGGLSI